MTGPGKKWIDQSPLREVVFACGVMLILISPAVGAIPGPGGVVVFGAGLAMVLRTSRWAQRLYARLKRRYPKLGRWTDWGLRRRSALRREAILKEKKRRLSAKKAQQGD